MHEDTEGGRDEEGKLKERKNKEDLFVSWRQFVVLGRTDKVEKKFFHSFYFI